MCADVKPSLSLLNQLMGLRLEEEGPPGDYRCVQGGGGGGAETAAASPLVAESADGLVYAHAGGRGLGGRRQKGGGRDGTQERGRKRPRRRGEPENAPRLPGAPLSESRRRGEPAGFRPEFEAALSESESFS